MARTPDAVSATGECSLIPSGPLLRIGHDRFVDGLARLVDDRHRRVRDRQLRGHEPGQCGAGGAPVQQQHLARKKDVIARWFGEWDEVNGTAWQSAVLGKSTVAAALKKSSDAWNDLRKS